MGSETPQLCFNVYAATEENLYVSAEEVSYASSFVVANSFIIRKRTSGKEAQLQCLTTHHDVDKAIGRHVTLLVFSCNLCM